MIELPVDGDAAPPRTNGELVFDAPWQSRLFGVTATLVDSGAVGWSEMQAALISEVARVDAAGSDTGDPAVYWGCWLDALGRVVSAGGVIDPDGWHRRVEELAARPEGHDHSHPH